jgi:hypothetical protein
MISSLTLAGAPSSALYLGKFGLAQCVHSIVLRQQLRQTRRTNRVIRYRMSYGPLRFSK